MAAIVKQGHYVEHLGDCWQSVFPQSEAEKTCLHDTMSDALAYMVTGCGVELDRIVILQRRRRRFWPSH